MENEIFSELVNSIKDKNTIDDAILAFCKQLERNKKVSELIFSKAEESNVLARVITSLKAGHSQEQNHAKDMAPADIFLSEFNEKGIIGVLRYWILNGFKEPAEAVATFFSTHIQKGSRENCFPTNT